MKPLYTVLLILTALGCNEFSYDIKNSDMGLPETNFVDYDLSLPSDGPVKLDMTNMPLPATSCTGENSTIINNHPYMEIGSFTRSLNSHNSCEYTKYLSFSSFRIFGQKYLNIDVNYKAKFFNKAFGTNPPQAYGMYSDEIRIGIVTTDGKTYILGAIGGYDISLDDSKSRHVFVSYDLPGDLDKSVNGIYINILSFYSEFGLNQDSVFPEQFFKENTTITINNFFFSYF